MPDDQPTQTADATRGREAEHPQDIPVLGWKNVARRAWKDFQDKNLSLVAGGVTYYVILALFPGLAALVSIYGLVADPNQIEQQLNSLNGLLRVRPGSLSAANRISLPRRQAALSASAWSSAFCWRCGAHRAG